MTAPRARYKDQDIRPTDCRTEGRDDRSAILILGSCCGGAFVAGEVLICADTLSTEEAIRAWLAGHEVHVTSPNGLTVPTTGLGRE